LFYLAIIEISQVDKVQKSKTEDTLWTHFCCCQKWKLKEVKVFVCPRKLKKKIIIFEEKSLRNWFYRMSLSGLRQIIKFPFVKLNFREINMFWYWIRSLWISTHSLENNPTLKHSHNTYIINLNENQVKFILLYYKS
jgi:hypothetical protein